MIDRGQRAHPRFDVAIPVRYADSSRVDYTRDVSVAGMFLRSDAPPSVGETVRCFALLPGGEREVPVQGVVTYVRTPELAEAQGKDVGAGVRFAMLEPGVREQLERFVDALGSDLRRHALVVFPRALDRDVVSRALRSLRTTVTSAVSARGAAEAARFGGFDVVLADVELADAGGISLRERFRDDAAMAAVPFVLFGERIDANARKRAYAAGVSRILLKPVRRLEVLRIVEELAPTGLTTSVEPADELRALALQARDAGDIDIALEALHRVLALEPDDEIAGAALRAIDASLLPAERVSETTRFALAVPADELARIGRDLTVEDAYLVSRFATSARTVAEVATACQQRVPDVTATVQRLVACRVLRVV